jgi:hypothetical protein
LMRWFCSAKLYDPCFSLMRASSYWRCVRSSSGRVLVCITMFFFTDSFDRDVTECELSTRPVTTLSHRVYYLQLAISRSCADSSYVPSIF